MPRHTGEVTWMGEMGLLVRDLQACVHCSGQWVIDPAGPARGFCRNCYGPTCGREGCVTTCQHWEKDMEIVERMTRAGAQAPMRCAHCHVSWQPQPGSGRERGWCLRCNGSLCGAARCRSHVDHAADYRHLFEDIAHVAGVR